ncbi:MAG: hypothetical protein R2712_11100 [Vicinamibacterales bacterium]
MDIDRRAFLASVGGVAALDVLDSEAKAEAPEHYMMDVLDGVDHGLVADGEAAAAAAPDATIRRGAGSLFGPTGPSDHCRMPSGADVGEADAGGVLRGASRRPITSCERDARSRRGWTRKWSWPACSTTSCSTW